MENYARIFESALYRRTFVVTFQISIAVTVICVFLGYPLCYWLTKMSDRTAAILMVFVLVPFWTSVLVRTYAWLVLLQRNGIINSSLDVARRNRGAAATGAQPDGIDHWHGTYYAAVSGFAALCHDA